jgi:hypothetical protein
MVRRTVPMKLYLIINIYLIIAANKLRDLDYLNIFIYLLILLLIF